MSDTLATSRDKALSNIEFARQEIIKGEKLLDKINIHLIRQYKLIESSKLTLQNIDKLIRIKSTLNKGKKNDK